MSRPLRTLALLVGGAILGGCTFQHASPRGPLALVADSIRRHARSVDCDAPDHPIFGDLSYRVCSTEIGNALYDVDRDGRILSVAESWTADSASADRTQGLIAALDHHTTRVVLPEGSWTPLGVRWRGDSICHSVIVDSTAGEVIYLRTLRIFSSDCSQG